MDKRWISALVVAIILALLGTVAIQVKWMRDTLALREAQTYRSVDNALFAVSDRLEQVEKMRDLKRHKAGRRLLRKLDAIRRAEAERDLALRTEMEPEPEPPGPAPEAPDPAEDVELVPSEPMETAPDEHVGAAHDHETMITDMVRGILAGELERDIHERIDLRLLDSLLTAELRAAGIQGPMHYGVRGEDGTLVELGHEEVAIVGDGTVHRERLFRHDLTGPRYYLEVELTEQPGLWWPDLLPMLLASAACMGIIVAAFLFTIRAIFRQKRIGEIRNDLVNNLTHELKTPISTIGLACEALADPSMPKTEDQVRTFVNMIRDENKRLGSLVENVLQSAVLESGHMVLKRVDLDMHALISDVVRSSAIQVSRRNGRMDLDLRAEIHHVHGDRIHLTNLLYNLIDNAVKYAEQEPRIRIATRNDNEGITVSVSDNGIGIAPSEQRKVFERLYRVPTGNIHNAKGFGLGLSYVRVVVERHGGRIRLESAPGRGSTFHIFIPFEHGRTP